MWGVRIEPVDRSTSRRSLRVTMDNEGQRNEVCHGEPPLTQSRSYVVLGISDPVFPGKDRLDHYPITVTTPVGSLPSFVSHSWTQNDEDKGA